MNNNRSINVYRLVEGAPAGAVASGFAPASIDVILPGNFTGTAQPPAPLAELLLYDAGGGVMSLYRVAAGAELQLVKTHDVSRRWDILVGGNFKGGVAQAATEVLLYDRRDGVSKFIRFEEDGDLIEFGKQDWTEKWDVIVAGRFGSSSGDDLAFYDRESGRLKIHECVDGQLTRTLVDVTGEPGCAVVAGRFGNGVNDDLFFYHPATGAGLLFEVNAGDLSLRKTYSSLPKDREVLVRGRLVSLNLPHQLLFYDRDRGAADVYGFRHPDRVLELRMQRQLPAHAHAVVPCNFVKASPECDELFVYGIHNRAAYLSWGAHVDTSVNFNEFFDHDHTVMCWFMPQFVHANYQPVLAENGGGAYAFGLADYSHGNVVYNKDAGTQFNKAGDAVFYVRVGDETRLYRAPEASEGAWIHLALVRRGNRFALFLNGVHKTPAKFENVKTTVKDDEGNDVEVVQDKTAVRDTEIVVPGATFTKKPSGTLRIGRRTSGAGGEQNSRWQTYGLVDDVAVFATALHAADIQKVVSERRLRGDEDGLLACWPFDALGSDSEGVFRTWTLSSRPGAARKVPMMVPVSAGRSSDNDARWFSDSVLLDRCHVVVPLPFKAGEEWKVGQGMNSDVGSHMGSPAFCYDFSRRAGGDATKNVPVVACVTGRVHDYKKNDEGGPREQNSVTIQYIDDRIVNYMHLAKNSLNPVIKGGTLDPSGDPNDPEDDRFLFDHDGPELKTGDLVGKVGPFARHLHFGARGSIGPYITDQSPSIPVAFRDFERLDPTSNTWKPVAMSFLRTGDVFRNRT